MKQTPTFIDPGLFPESLREFIVDAPVFDSSCSQDARVYYLRKNGGYYLKTAPRGTLDAEATMTRFFHGKGLSAEVIAYESTDRDYLLTRAVSGTDCLDMQYLDDPKRLSETLGILLRRLHETNPSDCPVADRASAFIAATGDNHRLGKWHPSRLPKNGGRPLLRICGLWSNSSPAN